MGASNYLSRTFGTPTNANKWTMSLWDRPTGGAYTFCPNTDNGHSNFAISHSSGNLNMFAYSDSGTTYWWLTPNALYRDKNGWYHVVVAYDSAQATASDRVKMYINGEQITSFSTETYPTQNTGQYWNTAVEHLIGKRGYDPSFAFEGSLAHFHFCDGYAYQASDFGETDVTTGIWKPKTAPSVSYGNNGFFLKFENSGSMGTDSSGNGNNWTVNGTIGQTVDTPSNVFATFNPLDNRRNAATGNLVIPTLSNGNLQATGTSSDVGCICNSTIAINNGKYYAEYKISNLNQAPRVGIISKYLWDSSSFPTSQTDTAYSYRYDANKEHNGTASSYGASYTTGDIIGVAFDCTNGNLEFYKNGVSQGVAFTGIPSNQDWCFMYVGLLNDTAQANFGNGYFGTTAVSSAQNPDDGIGIFEYDVPTGYRALCTKSINAQEYS